MRIPRLPVPTDPQIGSTPYEWMDSTNWPTGMPLFYMSWGHTVGYFLYDPAPDFAYVLSAPGAKGWVGGPQRFHTWLNRAKGSHISHTVHIDITSHGVYTSRSDHGRVSMAKP